MTEVGDLNIKVRIDTSGVQAGINQTKAGLKTLGMSAKPAANGLAGVGAAAQGTTAPLVNARVNTDALGRSFITMGAKAAGMGNIARGLGGAFSSIGPALTQIKAGFATMSASMTGARAGMVATAATAPTLTAGLAMVGMGFKALGVAIATAMLPLIAIMLIIQAALWIWNKFKERQEKARKQMEATKKAAAVLGTTMKNTSEDVKKYGNAWADTVQQMVAFGQKAPVAADMARKIHEQVNRLREVWTGLSEEDAIGMFTSSLGEGLDGLRKWGIYMTEAEVKAYALEKGIIAQGEAFNWTAQQAAMLQLIIEGINSGPIPGINITDGMLAAAEAADKAKKSLGLMAFDALNSVKKADDAATKNPFADLFGQIAYSDTWGPMNDGAEEQLGWWGKIKKFGENAWNTIKGAGEAAWGAIHGFGEWAWGGIKGAGETAWNFLKGAGEKIWPAIKGAGEWAWNGIKGVGETVWNGLKGAGEGIWNGITTVAGGAWDTIKGAGEKIWDSLSTTAGSLWDGFKSKAEDIWNGIKSFGEGILSGLSSFFGGILDGIKSGLKGVVDGAKDALGGVADKVGGLWSGFKQTIGLEKRPEQQKAAEIDSTGGTGGGLIGSAVKNITLQLDGKTLAQVLADDIVAEAQRRGAT